MQSLAAAHQKQSGKSYAQAYTHVFSHPDNRELAEQIKNEHLSRSLLQMHGSGTIS